MGERKRVVVVGGGFGGLNVTRALRRLPVDVTLVDRRNFHLFQPLLYQVATGGLSPADIASPLRGILKRQRNARVIQGEVDTIDPQQQVVCIGAQRFSYDYLVLATGARHHYFGNDSWEQAAPGVAKCIQNRLRGRDQGPFSYKDRGSMAVIGRAAAVAQLGRLKLHGLSAWLVWLFVHLINIVGYQNRLLVLIQWGWNYITRNRSARLITFEDDSQLP